MRGGLGDGDDQVGGSRSGVTHLHGTGAGRLDTAGSSKGAEVMTACSRGVLWPYLLDVDAGSPTRGRQENVTVQCVWPQRRRGSGSDGLQWVKGMCVPGLPPDIES